MQPDATPSLACLPHLCMKPDVVSGHVESDMATLMDGVKKREVLKHAALNLVILDREARCKAGMDEAAHALDDAVRGNLTYYRGELDRILERPEVEHEWRLKRTGETAAMFAGCHRHLYRKQVDMALRGSRMLR